MIITYKIEVKPTEEQKWLIDKHIGGSRWAYNLFLEINQRRYQDGYWYIWELTNLANGLTINIWEPIGIDLGINNLLS